MEKIMTPSRILVATIVDGTQYHPNQVVEFSELRAKQLAATGQIDIETAAVSYCIDILKAELIKHPEPAPAAAMSAKSK